MKIKSFMFGLVVGLFIPLAAGDFMILLLKDVAIQESLKPYLVTSDEVNVAILENDKRVLAKLLELPTEDAWKIVCSRETVSGKSPIEILSERYPSIEPAEFFGQFINRRLNYSDWDYVR